MENKVFKILTGLTFLLSAVLLISFMVSPTIGLDSGFYLAIGREFYSGKVYFHEIGIAYTPLSIITFGIPFLFDDMPSYQWHLLMNVLITIGSSFIFYNLLKRISNNKSRNLFFVSAFVLLSFVFDGRHLMLEPLSVFFQLLALYFYLNFREYNTFKNLFLSGVTICLAFLSKQYGLFILLPIAADLILNKKEKLKSILLLSSGMLLPLILFFGYLSSYGVNLVEFIKFILGKGTEFDNGNGTAINASTISHFIELLYFILFNLYLLIIPVLLVLYYKVLDTRKVLYILLFLSSLTVLKFATYFHYFLYVVPYSLLLFAYLFSVSKNKKVNLLSYVLLGVSLCFWTLYIGLTLKNGNQAYISKQQEEIKILNTYIPKKSRVYLDGPSPALYYLCDFQSINLKKISFVFPDYFFPKSIASNMESGAYIVTPKKKQETYENLLQEELVKEVVLGGKEYVILRQK
ncbi:conserved membrane protein of unknown function [Tenacibaculum sp. 190130A14a]|uniref:Glycosyltransferase RgtA/B/C/D-like domain-containing protein n=1 Tax=Tenacibaculum polynesiense TaxID=3137857 RepID=A0ABP1EYK7_9FLAO